MSSAGWVLWSASLGIVGVLLWNDWARRYHEAPGARRATLFIAMSLLVIGLGVIGLSQLETRETMAVGAPPFPWMQVSLLFLAMILGMIAQYFYFHDVTKLDWSSFTKPFFASPIVFLPLVSATQGSMDGLEVFEMSDLMLLLVAFQNGFFWKMVFDRQQQQATDT